MKLLVNINAKKLPGAILGEDDFAFKTPTEVATTQQAMSKIDVPYDISWADVERDLTAWIGNPLQDSAMEFLGDLKEQVLASKDDGIIESWRKLQTSDHFYYMCTKWFSDGDVHKYFNPYRSPHDAYVVYCNILNDIEESLKLQKG